MKEANDKAMEMAQQSMKVMAAQMTAMVNTIGANDVKPRRPHKQQNKPADKENAEINVSKHCKPGEYGNGINRYDHKGCTFQGKAQSCPELPENARCWRPGWTSKLAVPLK